MQMPRGRVTSTSEGDRMTPDFNGGHLIYIQRFQDMQMSRESGHAHNMFNLIIQVNQRG